MDICNLEFRLKPLNFKDHWLIYKMPYPSYRFDDPKLLEFGNPVSYTDHTQLTMYYFTDIINAS